jgi:sugar O-acyltransferase (sialic acid O-acetyltransferase NeuD family)
MEQNSSSLYAGGNMNKLIIVGTNSLAEIAYEYFTHDSKYDVVGFSVEKAFLTDETFLNLPLVAFEEIEKTYIPKEHSVFVSLGYGHMNKDRTRLYLAAKDFGYSIASYVSSESFVWKNVRIGEHCFIFEDNTIQPFVEIGNNVILWSGNHIGHHSVIGDNCFISSHVVVSGLCTIGKNCFFGVNSTVANGLSIGEFSVIGAAANVVKDAAAYKVHIGNPAKEWKDIDEMGEIR